MHAGAVHGQQAQALPGLVQPQLIHLGMQGAVGLIEQKQDQIGEGQMAFAGKVLRMGAMLGNKIGAA